MKNDTEIMCTMRTIIVEPDNCYQKQYETYTVHFTLKLHSDDVVYVKLDNCHSDKITLVAKKSYFEGYRIK